MSIVEAEVMAMIKNDEELFYKRNNVYDVIDENEEKEMQTLCDEYRAFLDTGKTERECVYEGIRLAKENGYKNLDEVEELKPGDKVYKINRGKNILLAVIGSEDIEKGINLVGAHIDSPRLDLKQNPLYESNDMALLKTHYYGGIKKYQWTTIPLAMHGVVYTKNGERAEIKIGEDENDPVFIITDLLPHLASEQMTKKMTEGIGGEDLNILIGGRPMKSDDAKEKVKLAILKKLNEKYNMTERDFQTAEIEMVPAFKAKNVGLDESFIGAYGQDDRVCAFTTLKAVLEVEKPGRTAMAILVDKEEIGSCGNTGALSAFFEMTVAEIIEKLKGSCTITSYNKCIANSACMSSDVNAGVDPTFESVSEKRNASFLNGGVVLTKYTGARGKSGSSDANAEFVYEIAKIMDDAGVVWQTGELGKVDQGGGGTIAQYVANLNMDVIDAGVSVLSMHAPYEITAKTDVYMAYRAYKAFYEGR
ncbi:MAG: aminopeptidase [Clostridiales bacterium]|nr:aminopeptidase [Clostridiales bacterium]